MLDIAESKPTLPVRERETQQICKIWKNSPLCVWIEFIFDYWLFSVIMVYSPWNYSWMIMNLRKFPSWLTYLLMSWSRLAKCSLLPWSAGKKLRFFFKLPHKTYLMRAWNRPLMLGRVLKYHTFLISTWLWFSQEYKGCPYNIIV